MTLYDLMNNITLQGHIEIQLFDKSGEEKESRFFEHCEDLNGMELPDGWEDKEVSYIYPQKFTRKHWTWAEESSCLIIEIKE